MSDNKATPHNDGPDPELPARDHSEPTLKTPSISPADAEKLASKYQASWDQFTPVGEPLPPEPTSTSDSGAWSQQRVNSAGEPRTDGKLDPDQTGRTSVVPMSSAKRSPIVWGAAAAAAAIVLIVIFVIRGSQHSDDGTEENALPEQAESTGPRQPILPEPILAHDQQQAPVAAPPTSPGPQTQAVVPPAPQAPVAAPPAPPVVAQPTPAPPPPVRQAAPPPAPPPVVAARPAPVAPVERPAPTPRVAAPSHSTTHVATPANTTTPAHTTTPAPAGGRRQRGGFIADNPY